MLSADLRAVCDNQQDLDKKIDDNQRNFGRKIDDLNWKFVDNQWYFNRKIDDLDRNIDDNLKNFRNELNLRFTPLLLILPLTVDPNGPVGKFVSGWLAKALQICRVLEWSL